MKYLSDSFNLSKLNLGNLEQSFKVRTISKDDVKKKLSDVDGYESVIENEDSARNISNILNVTIPLGKGLKELTPYDTLIVAQPNELSDESESKDNPIKFIMVEINSLWKVDFYSRDRELLQEITLGNMSYREAKKESFLAGVRIPYYIYDIYYLG